MVQYTPLSLRKYLKHFDEMTNSNPLLTFELRQSGVIATKISKCIDDLILLLVKLNFYHLSERKIRNLESGT